MPLNLVRKYITGRNKDIGARSVPKLSPRQRVAQKQKFAYSGKISNQTKSIIYTMSFLSIAAQLYKINQYFTVNRLSALWKITSITTHSEDNIDELFELAKQDTVSIYDHAVLIKGLFQNKPEILYLTLETFIHLISANIFKASDEYQHIKVMSEIFGMPRSKYLEMIRRYFIPNEENPYKLLNANENMNRKELRAVYCNRVKSCHPDMINNENIVEELKSIAVERFYLFTNAYESIINKAKK